MLILAVPEVHVIPRLQSRRPGEGSEMFCHVTGEPFPAVTWLKNDEPLHLEQPHKYEIIGNGTALKVHNISFSDTGESSNIRICMHFGRLKRNKIFIFFLTF